MSSRTRYFNRYTPYRSGIAQRARRQQRAADEQRDSTTVTINTDVSFDCGQTMNEIYKDKGEDGWFDTGCMAINVYDVLRHSDYYQSFGSLYDQVKIDNIRARIIATNWATSRESNDEQKINEIIKARSYVIVTAWDRSGISKSQVKFDDKWNDDVTNHKFYCTIGKNIESYSSAKTKHLGPGNAYEIVRQLYPENLYEKSQFVSTSLLKSQQNRVNTEFFAYNCFYKKVVDTSVNANGYIYEPYDFNTKYPTNLISDPAVPFKPTLLVNVVSGPTPYVTNIKEKDPEGFYTLLTVGVNKIKPVTFNVEFEIVVTFRGLRYNRNVDTKEPERTPLVKVLYPLDNSGVTDGEFNIENIYISDSKYNNSQGLDAQYSYGGLIRRDDLPDENMNRYVIYLDDPEQDPSSDVPPGNRIYIINYGNKKFVKKFNRRQIFLMDFVGDSYKEVETDNKDFINVKMKKFVGDGIDPEDVFKRSKRLVIPITEYNPQRDEIGTLLFGVPDDYKFTWENDKPDDDNHEMNIDDDEEFQEIQDN